MALNDFLKKWGGLGLIGGILAADKLLSMDDAPADPEAALIFKAALDPKNEGDFSYVAELIDEHYPDNECGTDLKRCRWFASEKLNEAQTRAFLKALGMLSENAPEEEEEE